jgi:hypothetical protein
MTTSAIGYQLGPKPMGKSIVIGSPLRMPCYEAALRRSGISPTQRRQQLSKPVVARSRALLHA